MSKGVVTAAYIIAAIFFIFSLAGLSKHETSHQGNIFGMTGMAIALIATILGLNAGKVEWIIAAMVIGSTIGIYLACAVEVTEIPELVAIFHSFVGFTAILVGFNSFLDRSEMTDLMMANTHLTEVFLGIFIGAVTFTGSVVAFGKLRGIISSKPLMLPHHHKMNLAALVVSFLLLLWFINTSSVAAQSISLLFMTATALIFGWNLVASISDADIPIVVSMMNSSSGWTAAASGFMLSNDLLIVTGALVGCSGAILSYIMCKEMNRSFFSVMAGGFGIIDSSSTGASEEMSKYGAVSAEEVAQLLKSSSAVIIIPGYGMVVAQAQYLVHDITTKLCARGIKVRFGIHPVAGRLPGHMNVLLAKAKVPYDVVLEIDKINDDFSNTDTVLVIGANDTVNLAAQDPDSQITGRSVLEVWKAQNVIVLKRSLREGYAGVQNPLRFKENTHILFGDIKESVEAILKEL
ncbi:MAG: Re/Si-specific NAD(P)(+) transhydrogenase subunit beta [Candidatus Malihini olakiniferum]